MKAVLDIPLSLKEVARAMGAAPPKADGVIRCVTTDSRDMVNDALFFPLKNSEEYVKDALKVGFSVSEKNPTALRVKSVSDAFLDLASYYKTKLSLLKKTVAITGSVGKTTVKDYTAALLASKYKTHKSEGNFNNDIGMPLSVFSAPADTKMLVLEMGMNHSGEIERLSLAAKPDIAVITNIGSAHIGKLGSREAIAAAKREIMRGLTKGAPVIVPKDEPLLASLNSRITFGEDGDFAYKITNESHGEVSFILKTQKSKTEAVTLPLMGTHLIKNLTAAVAASFAAGLDINEVLDALKNKKAFLPRQKLIPLGGIQLFDDCYNASLESYDAAFRTLTWTYPKTSAVIGDILELGDYSEEIHHTLGALCKKYGLLRIYPFGKYSNTVKDGAVARGFSRENIFCFENTTDPDAVAKCIVEKSEHGEVVLIKGSHALHTERITECIKRLKGD